VTIWFGSDCGESLAPPLQEVSARLDAVGQRQRLQCAVDHRLVADHDAALGQQRHDIGRHDAGQRLAGRLVAGADVEVGERGRLAQLRDRLGQGVAEIAEEDAVLGRDAIGMRRDLAVEDIDVAAGQPVAQVIVRAAVAEAELQDVSRKIGDQLRRVIEAGALRLQAADE